MVTSATKPALIAKEHPSVPKFLEFPIALCTLSMGVNVVMIHIIMVIAFNMVVYTYQKNLVEVNVSGLAYVLLKNVTH